jgi:hypothetical protein
MPRVTWDRSAGYYGGTTPDSDTATISNSERTVYLRSHFMAVATQDVPATGKFYWEISFPKIETGGATFNSEMSVGFHTHGNPGSSGVGAFVHGLEIGVWYVSGTTNGANTDYPDGEFTTEAGGSASPTDVSLASILAEGDILQVAIDRDAEKFWIGVNGSWTQSNGAVGDPANDLNPNMDYSAGDWSQATKWLPHLSGYSGATGLSSPQFLPWDIQFVSNFEADEWNYAAPVGFTSISGLETAPIGYADNDLLLSVEATGRLENLRAQGLGNLLVGVEATARIASVRTYSELDLLLTVDATANVSGPPPIRTWTFRYTDPPLKTFTMPYSSSVDMLVRMPYGEYVDFTHTAPYSLVANFTAERTMPYTSYEDFIATRTFPYELQVLNPVARTHHMSYSLLEATTPIIVTGAAYLEWGGLQMELTEATLSQDEGDPHWRFEGVLAQVGDWKKLSYDDAITVSYLGEDYSLIVDNLSISRSGPVPTLSVRGLSPYAAMFKPRDSATDFIYTSDTSSRTIVEALWGSATTWDIEDWPVPRKLLDFRSITRGDLISSLVAAVGGVVQSYADGTLWVRYAFPTATNDYASATIAATLTDSADQITLQGSTQKREGFNRFVIRSSPEDTNGDVIEYYQYGNESYGELRVYPRPFRPVSVVHTGPSEVQLTSQGLITRQETETIEIFHGEGSVAYPIRSIDTIVWKSADLTGLTFDSGETTVTSTHATARNSIAEITYTTRAYVWAVSYTGADIVQFLVFDA